MRISTNILRDQDAAFDYIVTENTQYIYDHLEAAWLKMVDAST